MPYLYSLSWIGTGLLGSFFIFGRQHLDVSATLSIHCDWTYSVLLWLLSDNAVWGLGLLALKNCCIFKIEGLSLCLCHDLRLKKSLGLRCCLFLLSLHFFSVALLVLKGHSTVNLYNKFPVQTDSPPCSLNFRDCIFHFFDNQRH